MLKVKRLTHTATLPNRATSGSVGYDLCADTPNENIAINTGQRVLIHTGLSMSPPPEYFIRIMPKSGLAWKQGIQLMAGVIDIDYTGEIFVMMYNAGNEVFMVEHKMKIAQ